MASLAIAARRWLLDPAEANSWHLAGSTTSAAERISRVVILITPDGIGQLDHEPVIEAIFHDLEDVAGGRAAMFWLRVQESVIDDAQQALAIGSRQLAAQCLAGPHQ